VKFFLVDASAAIHFYLPRKPALSEILTFLYSQKLAGKAVLFIPSFCIAEVKNYFAQEFYRKKRLKQTEYELFVSKFIEHVHNRTVFYSYDLSRYHNLNIDDVLKYEHTIDTEFNLSEVAHDPTRSPSEEAELIREALRRKGHKDNIGAYHLSTYDQLIVSMGIELNRLNPACVHIVTDDRRLAQICNEGKKSERTKFPPAHYINYLDLNKFRKQCGI